MYDDCNTHYTQTPVMELDNDDEEPGMTNLTTTHPQSTRAQGPAAPPTRPEGKLGPIAIIFMALAGSAPLAAMVAVWPLIVGASGSTVNPLLWFLAAVILLIFAIGFTRMTKYVRNAGAFYSYVQGGLGKVIGLGAAILAIGVYLFDVVAVAAFAGIATSEMIVYFDGPSSPWWVWALGLVLVIAVLGYLNIDISAKVLGVMLVLEVLIVLVINVAILAQGGQAGINFAPLNPAEIGMGTPSLGIMFAFFAFIGFEATAVFRDEARDPDRTIPRATFGAVIGIGLFYSFSAWVMQLGVGTDRVLQVAEDNPTRMVLDLATTYVAPIMQDIMQVLLMTSIMAAALLLHNMLTRYVYTLGRQRVLPATLGRIHEKHLAPSRASIVVTVAVAVLFFIAIVLRLDPVDQVYTWFSGLATLGIVTLMTLTSMAVLVFFIRRHRSRLPVSKWTMIVAPAIASAALFTLLTMILMNFDLIVGHMVTAVVLVSALLTFFVAGIVLALVIRAKQQEKYSQLDADIVTVSRSEVQPDHPEVQPGHPEDI